jgi:OOP family OmpA-OmpF porin
MKKLIFAVIASATAMGAAQAQSVTPVQVTPSWYVGAGVASAEHDNKISGPGVSDINDDSYKANAKVFAGYDFNSRYGIEAGYTDFRGSDTDYAVNGVRGSAESEGEAFYVAGKVSAPITPQFSVFGKLGVSHNKAELNGANLRRTRSDTEVYAGVGAQYNLNQQVALVAEYERYGKSKDFGPKADVLTVGARYSF